MTARKMNSPLNLVLAQHRLCAQLSNEQVVLKFAQDDGTVLDFVLNRKALRSLKCQVLREQASCRLQLQARDGSQCLMQLASAECAQIYIDDLRGVQQLLAPPWLTRPTVKIFALGSLVGAMLVIALAIWITANASRSTLLTSNGPSVLPPINADSATSTQEPEQWQP